MPRRRIWRITRSTRAWIFPTSRFHLCFRVRCGADSSSGVPGLLQHLWPVEATVPRRPNPHPICHARAPAKPRRPADSVREPGYKVRQRHFEFTQSQPCFSTQVVRPRIQRLRFDRPREIVHRRPELVARHEVKQTAIVIGRRIIWFQLDRARKKRSR